jgi:hypothetical protein
LTIEMIALIVDIAPSVPRGGSGTVWNFASSSKEERC